MQSPHICPRCKVITSVDAEVGTIKKCTYCGVELLPVNCSCAESDECSVNEEDCKRGALSSKEKVCVDLDKEDIQKHLSKISKTLNSINCILFFFMIITIIGIIVAVLV